ncbi:TPA: Abi family protein, partial [Pseudomonas aeruginosa]|nr:Abi family protein [Pseudomonas aeruginosa]
RTVIAHELGRYDPLCYLSPKTFSKDAFVDDERLRKGPSYKDWISRHHKRIAESQEDSIVAHRHGDKPIPIWAAAEVWDFGALSKFYSMLSGSNQDLICSRVGISERNVIDNWLINMNVLRNRCAHHSRVFNRPNPRGLKIPKKGYFNDLQLDAHAREKLFGLIAVCWYLLKKIGPGSDWIRRVADLIDSIPSVPGFGLSSMGIRTESFPRRLFPEAVIVVKMVAPVVKDFSTLSSEALGLTREAVKYLECNLVEAGAIDEAKGLIDALLGCAQDVEDILEGGTT